MQTQTVDRYWFRNMTAAEQDELERWMADTWKALEKKRDQQKKEKF